MADGLTFKFDSSKLSRVLSAHARASQSVFSRSLNRFMKNVAWKAYQLTRVRSAGEIESLLKQDKLALRIVTAALKRRAGTFKRDKEGNIKSTKKGKQMVWGRVTRKQIAAGARRLIAKRKSASGYVRLGWAPIINDFGGHIGGRAGGAAGKSFGQIAKPDHLEALMENFVTTLMDGKAGPKTRAEVDQALVSAVDSQVDDMVKWATARIGDAWLKQF
jgi:hypothetical protein